MSEQATPVCKPQVRGAACGSRGMRKAERKHRAPGVRVARTSGWKHATPAHAAWWARKPASRKGTGTQRAFRVSFAFMRIAVAMATTGLALAESWSASSFGHAPATQTRAPGNPSESRGAHRGAREAEDEQLGHYEKCGREQKRRSGSAELELANGQWMPTPARATWHWLSRNFNSKAWSN